MSSYADVPLFDGYEPKRRQRQAPPRKPQWSSAVMNTGKACDDCLVDLHKRGGTGPLVPRARWKRTANDGSVRLMCYRHAQEQRRVDRLDPLPADPGR